MFEPRTAEEQAQPSRSDAYIPEGIDREKTHAQARFETGKDNLIVVVHDHSYRTECRGLSHYMYKGGERIHEWEMK